MINKVNKNMTCSNTDCVYLSIHKICLYSDDIEGYVDCLSRDMIPAKNDDFKDCSCDCYKELNDLKEDVRFLANRAEEQYAENVLHPFDAIGAIGRNLKLLIMDLKDIAK